MLTRPSTFKKSNAENIVTASTNEPLLQSVKVKPDVLDIEPELFREMVSALAYYKAEQRGFEPGHELEDWLDAEQELLGNPSLLQKGMD